MAKPVPHAVGGSVDADGASSGHEMFIQSSVGKAQEASHSVSRSASDQIISHLTDIKSQLVTLSQSAATAASHSVVAAGAASAAASNSAAAVDIGHLAIQAIPEMINASLALKPASDGSSMSAAAVPVVAAASQIPQVQVPVPVAIATDQMKEVLVSLKTPAVFHDRIKTAWMELASVIERERKEFTPAFWWNINKPGPIDTGKEPFVKYALPAIEALIMRNGCNVRRQNYYFGTPYKWHIDLFPENCTGVVDCITDTYFGI